CLKRGGCLPRGTRLGSHLGRVTRRGLGGEGLGAIPSEQVLLRDGRAFVAHPFPVRGTFIDGRVGSHVHSPLTEEERKTGAEPDTFSWPRSRMIPNKEWSAQAGPWVPWRTSPFRGEAEHFFLHPV